MKQAPQTDLVLLRHGPTAWNEAGRMQGRSDQPLSDRGRTRVGTWHIPPEFEGYRWVTSPLRRARETAALLGHKEAETAPELVEANWGEWEGQRLSDLRARLGETMANREDRGLDFRPPGGESPRDLQTRLAPWLAGVAADGRPCLAVTHKGVIRAIFALAAGWDLRGKAPVKLRPDCAHQFHLSADGRPSANRMNLALLP